MNRKKRRREQGGLLFGRRYEEWEHLKVTADVRAAKGAQTLMRTSKSDFVRLIGSVSETYR